MKEKLNRLFSNSSMKSKRTKSRVVVLMLIVGLVVGLLPISNSVNAAIGDNITVTEKTGEADTMPALVDGQVWAGKTVDKGNNTDDIFNVSLSALGQGYKTTIETRKPANIVLVLDASTSMDNNNKLTNMITAANSLIDSILVTPGNKVSVVTFDRVARELVSLRNTDFTLLGSGSGNGISSFRINTVAATNIQAGMNVGYTVLRNAKNSGDTAQPFMLVLSDGATWYYNTNISGIITSTNNNSWTEDHNGHNGNGTSNNNGIRAAGYAIKQAKYLKDQMPDLKMFTIGYGIGNNKLTTATLHPTIGNIQAVTGSGFNARPLYNELGFPNSGAVTNAFNYPERYFASNENLADLVAAFNEILASININSPVANASTVTITDTISDDFDINGNLTMNLAGNTHTFTKSGTSYVSATAPAGVTVSLSGGRLTWTIPSTHMPYNSYAANGTTIILANPAKLSFNVELKAGAATNTNYYTNYNDQNSFDIRANEAGKAGANAVFVPSNTNPFYFDGYGAPIKTPINYMINTGKIILEPVKGDLKIKKNVVAYDGTNKGELANIGFVFNLTVDGYSGTGNIYNSTDALIGTFAINAGNGTFTLKDGEYATISNINAGSDYTVTENDYSASGGYVTSVTDNATGEIDKPNEEVIFTNTFYPTAIINIDKEIIRLYADAVTIPDGVGFPFGLYQMSGVDTYTKITSAGANVTTVDGDGDYSTTMNIKIKDLADLGLFNSTDSVTLYVHEEALTGAGTGWTGNDGYYPVIIGKNGSVTYDTNNDDVTIINKYIPTSGLTVTKSVIGGISDKSFDFTIVIESPNDYNYAYTLTVGSESPETLVGTGSRTIEVSLKHNESAVITGIPIGAPYTVTEDSYYDYTTKFTGSAALGNILAEAGTINVTNTYKPTLVIEKKGQDELLDGAEFELYIDTNNDGIPDDLVDRKTTGMAPDSSGLATFANLSDGSYWIIETQPPTGYYTLYSRPIGPFTVENGIITNNTGYVPTPDSTNQVFTITIENEPMLELPATGGMGNLPFVFGGIAIITIGMLAMRRRKTSAL